MNRSILLAVCALLSALVAWFLLWSLPSGGGIEEYEFAVLGDSLRNIGGLAAVVAASVAAWISYRTNETRRAEAVRSNFKDRMQWAVTHLNSDEAVERSYALGLIRNLLKDTDLDNADKELVLLVIKAYEEELTSENRELDAEDRELSSAVQEPSEQNNPQIVGETLPTMDNRDKERGS